MKKSIFIILLTVFSLQSMEMLEKDQDSPYLTLYNETRYNLTIKWEEGRRRKETTLTPETKLHVQNVDRR